MFAGVTFRVVPDAQTKADSLVPEHVLKRLGSGDIIIEGGVGWTREATWKRIKHRFEAIREKRA